mgnify:CR=1 FL=1|tara:strand:- start:1543 stop:1683 length:141 start_codon:yes stop_codon:yes gene_type:complete
MAKKDIFKGIQKKAKAKKPAEKKAAEDPLAAKIGKRRAARQAKAKG